MLDQHKLDTLITNIRAGKYRLPTYGLPPGITPGANPEAEKLYHMTRAVRDVAGGTPVPQAIVQIPEHQRAILSKEVPTTSLLEASNLIAKYEQRALSQNALFDQLRRLMKLSSPTMAEDMIRLIGEAKPAAGSGSSTAIHSDKNVGIRGFDSESDQSTLLHGFSGQRSAQRLMGTHGGEADMTRINLIVGAARNVLESVESFVSKRWKYRGDPRDLRDLSFAQITAHQVAHPSQWTYSAESGKPPSIDALLKASTFGYQGGKEKASARELPTDRPDPLNPFEDKDSRRDKNKSWDRDEPFIYEGKDNERLRQGIEAMLGSDLIQKDPKIRRLLEGAYSHPEMRKTLEHYVARTGSPALLQGDQERVIANLVNSRKDMVLREDLLAKAARIVSSGGFSQNALETIRESAAKVGYQKLVELIDTYHDPNFFHSDERGVALSAADMAYIERHHPREAKLIASLIGGGTSSSNLSDPRVRERLAQLPYEMGKVLRTIKTADQAQKMGIPLAQSQFSPFVTEMSALSYKLENGGILDPMALHSSVEGAFMRQSPDVSHAFLPGAQIGARSLPQGRLFAGVLSPQELAPFIQSEGAGVGLEGYERRLEDLLRHHAEGRANLPYGQAAPTGVDPLAAHQVKLSPEQVEHYQAELAQVQRLRGTLHDPSFQLQAGHYLNIVHRAATGKSAIDYSILPGSDKQHPYQRFMAPLNNQFREGARTLGSIEELVDALQGGISRLQGFGGIESDEVDRVMAALGHDPASNEFVLGKPRSLLPSGKTYHAARLARQFPDEEADLLAQFTRSPFQEGQTVAFMGGMPGFTDETRGTRGAGLEPGTVGTLHPIQAGINFGLTQNYGMFWENAMFTQEEYTRHKGKLYKGNPWLQQPAEPMALLRTRNGRQVPVRMSQVSDLQAKGLFSTSQTMLDRTRLRANLYASGSIERRRMRRQGMSLKTGGGASASSPSLAVPPRSSKETRPLPVVSKGYASIQQDPRIQVGKVAFPHRTATSHLETPPIADQLGGLARYLTGGSPDESIPPPSAEQMSFMLDPASRVVLKGGPGTGKTSTAVRRLMHGVAQGDLLPKNVLSVTALRSAAARLRDEYGKYQPLLPSGKEYDFPTPRTFASVARSTALRAWNDENDKPFFPILEKLGYKGLTGTVLTEASSEDLYDKDPDTVMHLQKTGQKAFIKEQVNTYLTSRGKKPYSDQQVSNLAKHINEVKKGRMGGYGLYEQIAAGKSATKEPYALDIQKGLRDLGQGVMSQPAGHALYEQGLRQQKMIDWDDLLSITVEAYQKFGPDALPDIFKGIQAILVDEGQDVNPLIGKLQEVFLSSLSSNNPQMMVAMDPMQALTQGMGGVPDAEIEEAYRGILGSSKPFHQLSQNFRGDANIAALHNAFLASPHLKGIPHAGLQESRSGNLGNPIQFMLGTTQPDVHRQMFRSMLSKTGVSHETMGLNIASGQHPFMGYTTPPHEIAAILPRNDDVSAFEHTARQELMSSFGLGKDQAHTVLKQIMRQGMPSPELSPEDPEWRQSRMQMPLLKFMGSRGQEYLHPHVEASLTGLWQRRNDIKGHLRNLFVGGTRTKAGGQLTFGAASHPFTGDEARAYTAGKLDVSDPEVMRELTKKSRKNDFESFQGQQVPRFFRDLMTGAQADIGRWGYNPDVPTPSTPIPQVATKASLLPPPPPSSIPLSTLSQQLPHEAKVVMSGQSRALVPFALPRPRVQGRLNTASPDFAELPGGKYGGAGIMGTNTSSEARIRAAIAVQQAHISQMNTSFWNNPMGNITPGDINRQEMRLGELKEQFKKATGSAYPEPPKALPQVAKPLVDADGHQHLQEIEGIGRVFPEKAIPTMGGSYGRNVSDAPPPSPVGNLAPAWNTLKAQNPQQHAELQRFFAGFPGSLKSGFQGQTFTSSPQEYVQRLSGLSQEGYERAQKAGDVYGMVKAGGQHQALQDLLKQPGAFSTWKQGAPPSSDKDVHISAKNATVSVPPGGTVSVQTGGTGGLTPVRTSTPPPPGSKWALATTPALPPTSPPPPPTATSPGTTNNPLGSPPPIQPSNTPQTQRGGGGSPPGGSGGGGGGSSGAAHFGRTMARIGYELQFIGQYLGTIVDQAIAQGSEYRRATVSLSGSGTSGTEGFYNFANTGGGISAYQRNTLPMYSTTQIAQGLHTFTGLTGYQGASPPLGALTDISAMAAMSGMDPTALMGPMAYLNGSSGRGSIQGSYTKLAGQLSNLLGGNLSEENLSPTLSALTQIVPTLQGLNPMGGSQTSQALSFFQLAQNAGMTPQNFGDVSSMLGGLSQVGSSPNLQQQYTLKQLGYNMTGAPQLAQYQQEETGRQEQLAQLHLMQNINGKGLSLPQLSIQIDQAQIRMDEANLVMSGIQLQQAQVSLQGQQLQYQYGQASYGFNLAQQNALYGPIGGDYSKLAGYSFQQNQLVSQRNFMSPEIGTMFTPQGVSGLRNQEFYAGLQNQQQSLILGRSPLLSDALFQQQMKYIAEQASFYKQELALRNQQREFDRVWQKRLLDQQGAQVAMQAKAVAYQGYIYGLQQQQFKLEKQKIQYDEKQAQIQQDFLGRQASDLQNIDSNITQFLQGKGPTAGGNLQPDQLVQNLANQLKSGKLTPTTLHNTIQGLGLPPADQKTLFQLVTQLASQPKTLMQMEQGLNKTNDKQLLDMFNKLKKDGAFTDQTQQAGQQNAYLQYAGVGPNWKDLSDHIKTIADKSAEIAKALEPTSQIALGISTIANFMGPVAVGIGVIANFIGLFGGFGGGGGGLGGLLGGLLGGGGGAAAGGLGGLIGPLIGGSVISAIEGNIGWNSFNPQDPGAPPWLAGVLGPMALPAYGGHFLSDQITSHDQTAFTLPDTTDISNWFKSIFGDTPTAHTASKPPVLTQGQSQYFAHDTSHAPPVMTQGQSQYFTHDSSDIKTIRNNTSAANLLTKSVADRNKTQDTLRNQQGQWFLDNQRKQIALQQQHLAQMTQATSSAHKDATQVTTNQGTHTTLFSTLNKQQQAAYNKQEQQRLIAKNSDITLGKSKADQDILVKNVLTPKMIADGIMKGFQFVETPVNKGSGGTTPMGHPGFTTPHVNAEFHQKMNYGIHQGVDFAAAQGTPIGAFNAGKVKNTGFYPWGGEVDVDIGHGLTERYLHLSQIGVVRGQPLLPRQRMGLTGGGTAASGLGYWSSGAHSHVQIDTGTYGSGVDPWPIWALTGARDISAFYGSGWGTTKGKTGGALRQLHDGGVAMRRVISEIGDGNEPEAVVPLSRLSTLLEQQSTRQRGNAGPSLIGSSPTHSVTVQKLADKFEVHVHTTQSKLDDQAVDDLGAQLFDILTESLQKLTGK